MRVDAISGGLTSLRHKPLFVNDFSCSGPGLTHGVKQTILWIVVTDQYGAALVDTMATVNLERGHRVPLLGVNSDNEVYALLQLTPTTSCLPLADKEESEMLIPFIVIGFPVPLQSIKRFLVLI